MPTISLNKEDLLAILGEDVDDDTLKETIPMMGTELEEFSDEITVEIFPDRPDMLSVEGFALALKSYLGIETGIYEIKAVDGSYNATIDKKVKKVRPDAVCAVVKNVIFNDAAIKSLMQVQEKLHLTHGRHRRRVAIGVHDLDKVTFPLCYTTKPKDYAFIPLERYTEMSIEQILQEHEKGIEYAHLLEGYDECPLWIDAEDRVLSMPPIINAEHTRVTERTKNLFIDVTGYGRKYLEQALNILIMSLTVRNGTVYSVKVTDVDENRTYPTITPKTMEIDLDYANKLLGVSLDFDTVSKFLERMGYGVDGTNVLIPPYRADIMHKSDIVEDIAIAYGFNKFEPEIPEISTIGEENLREKFLRKIQDLMTGYQLMEVKNYTLTNKDSLFTKMNKQEKSVVEMKNALTIEYNVLRNMLMPGLLHVYANNTHHGYPQNIFEVGRIFDIKNGEVKEKINLAVGICHEEANFTECKEILASFFKNVGIAFELEEKEGEEFTEGRSGSILVDRTSIGHIGEIHPEVLSNWGIGMPVASFELNLDRIYEKV